RRGRANDRLAGLAAVLQPLRFPSGPRARSDTSRAEVGRSLSSSTSDRVHARRRGTVRVRVSVLFLVAKTNDCTLPPTCGSRVAATQSPTDYPSVRRLALLLAALGAAGLPAAGAPSSDAGAAASETTNPIQAENAQGGTTAWQTPDEDGPAIEGYASEVSAVAGDTIHFHVSTTPASRYHIEVYRLGWYGGAGGRLLACIPTNCDDSRSGRPQAAGQPGVGGI